MTIFAIGYKLSQNETNLKLTEIMTKRAAKDNEKSVISRELIERVRKGIEDIVIQEKKSMEDFLGYIPAAKRGLIKGKRD